MLKLRFKPESADQKGGIVHLPASKSISNRLSIIQSLAENLLPISNWSEADDSRLMRKLLESEEKELDCGMAGTVMRFLTAYFSLQEGRELVLKGAERLHQRPIKPLVDALQELGAEINYVEKKGYPPLKINGRQLASSSLKIDASLSSQFVTALLLVAPYLKNGLDLQLQNPSSRPYIEMTLALMKKCGVKYRQDKDRILVEAGKYSLSDNYEIEADWSSAAFFYQYFALSNLPELKISGLTASSLQGDRRCVKFFEKVGVKTEFADTYVSLSKVDYSEEDLLLDMSDQPDLILPFVFTAVFLLPSVRIKGIHTLRIKESDRVKALITELEKLADIEFEIEQNELFIRLKSRNKQPKALSTHFDHRIAMSLAPLTLVYEELWIDKGEVVSKSFPGYWEELAKLGVISEAQP